MSLTVADIERWDVAAVREVAEALGARGAGAAEVRTGLGRLPMDTTWQGGGADAARAALDALATRLAGHGLEMARLASATRAGADEMERLQDALRRLETDCSQEGFAIDPVTGEVSARRPELIGDPVYAWQQAGLQWRVDALVAAASAADAELAGALTAAGSTPTAPAADVLSAPLPREPRLFGDFWARLTAEQRDLLHRRDPAIGNRDGMPAVDRDYYNRRTLAIRTGQATAAQQTADQLGAEHPDWAAGVGPPPNSTAERRRDYQRWRRQYDTARDRARCLPDLDAVTRAADGTDRLLLVLDTNGGALTHAAVAIGDPDTADHVSVTAPGLNTTVRTSLLGMADDAAGLRHEALRQLRGNPGHSLESVSTIAWLGYDTPQLADVDDAGAVLVGGWDVSHGQLASAGAHTLAGFYAGLTASHHAIPLHLTAIGHSYGSLTTGLALQQPGGHGVGDVIFYGSPGVAATTPGQLGLPEGHVFTMQTPDDPIRHVFDTPFLHAGAALLPAPFDSAAEAVLGTLLLTGAGQFGPDPATNPHFTRLETGPATITDGAGGTLALGGAAGHSEYADFADDGSPKTASYNIAAVVAGLSDHAVRD